MEQFKKAQIVLLPTKDKSPLVLGKNLGYLNNSNVSLKDLWKELEETNRVYNTTYTPQHLYFLSDDKIEEGDWYYCNELNNIQQCHSSPFFGLKVIATTDKSLKFEKSIGSMVINPNTWDAHQVIQTETIYLPQPYQQFIEKYIEAYNAGKPITEVLVEYKYEGKEYVDDQDAYGYDKQVLKVNPKDNTINIKSVKDSWNREEIQNLLLKAYEENFNKNPFNWIKENL